MNKLVAQGVSLAAITAVTLSASNTAQAEDFTIKVAGRLQIDYNIADADISGAEWRATELRRARLGVAGTYGSNLKYKVEFNTNSSEDVNVTDAWLQWTPTDADWNIKIGQFKTANSLDELNSSKYMSVIERSAFTDAFQFDRRVGVSVNTKGDNYTFTVGVFGDNLSNISDQESIAIAARGTFTPIKTDEALVHLGASFRYRDQGDTQSDIRYRQRAFAHVPSRIISTGSIAQSDMFYGVEAAGIFDKFWVAGEYGITDANCAACAQDPSLNGGYAEAGIIFGGKRTYKGGKFNRPKVDKPVTKGGTGAFGAVVRYDTIDLTDTSVNGGDLDTLIVGGDWWPNKYTRLSINYFNADANLGTSTSGLDSTFAALVTNGITAEKVSGVVARMQFDF